MRWWNALPRPRPGVVELPGARGLYDTAEQPARDQEPEPVYELAVGSVRRGVEGNGKVSQNIDLEPVVGAGRDSGLNGETQSLGVYMAETNSSLVMLQQAISSSASDSIVPTTELSNAPWSYELRPILGENELKALAGAFAPVQRPKRKPSSLIGPWLYRQIPSEAW
jgi:hypothetical protein